MTRRTERQSLDVADWPARDRAAWAAARQPVGPLDDGGLAANWSPKTVRQAEKGYGLWLGCLVRHGRLDPDAAPGARLTRETLTLLGHELLARVAPQTAASRVRDLSVMIRALDPHADRPPPSPVRLHPNLAEVYRSKVADLHRALEDSSIRDEALQILRGLVERIVITPAAEGLGETIELVGAIARMVELGNKKAALDARTACSVKVVAGAGFEPATFRL